LRYLIGLGNYTAFDDSIGVRVIEHVVENNLEHGFRAIDLGANSLSLVAYLDPATTAILIVDTARMGMAPGACRCFLSDEVLTRKSLPGLSTHEADVLKIVELARDAGQHIPPLAFFGIEPAIIKDEIGVSETLALKIPKYARQAISALFRM